MNTYVKFCPNVFIAKCDEKHDKDSIILVDTKYGNSHECIVFNLIKEKDECFYYSVVRADGFNVQEHAKRKALRLGQSAQNASSKSNKLWEASNEGADFLSLGEPIKIGHHSEKRHRALIERNRARMSKSVEMQAIADEYSNRAEYWEKKASTINLSMPESLEYYEFQLEKAKQTHKMLIEKPALRSHSYSLTYAKKEVNKFQDLLKTANLLWGDSL